MHGGLPRICPTLRKSKSAIDGYVTKDHFCEVKKLIPKEYRELRNLIDLSQGQLAKELGVTRESVCRRENGRDAITLEASLALYQVLEQAEERHLQSCVASGRETMAKLGVVV